MSRTRRLCILQIHDRRGRGRRSAAAGSLSPGWGRKPWRAAPRAGRLWICSRSFWSIYATRSRGPRSVNMMATVSSPSCGTGFHASPLAGNLLWHVCPGSVRRTSSFGRHHGLGGGGPFFHGTGLMASVSSVPSDTILNQIPPMDLGRFGAGPITPIKASCCASSLLGVMLSSMGC